MRRFPLLAVSALSVLAILACGGGGNSAKTGSSSSASTASGSGAASAPAAPQDPAGSSATSPAPKGTAFTVNNIETTITGAKFSKSVSQKYSKYAATEGATLIVVDYSVKNTGTEAVSCLSYADSVTDSKGVSYEDTMDCNMAVDTWAMDKLNPGLPKKYQACFEVPEGTSGFTMKFNCMWKDGYFTLGI